MLDDATWAKIEALVEPEAERMGSSVAHLLREEANRRSDLNGHGKSDLPEGQTLLEAFGPYVGMFSGPGLIHGADAERVPLFEEHDPRGANR